MLIIFAMLAALVIIIGGRAIHYRWYMLKLYVQKNAGKLGKAKCPQCKSRNVRTIGAMDNPIYHAHEPDVRITIGKKSSNTIKVRYQMECMSCSGRFTVEQTEPHSPPRVLPRDYGE